jgi:anti-anti-sigma regulatory factor
MEWLGGLSSVYVEAEFEVGIPDWAKDIILVNLPRKLQEHNELQRVIEMVHERGDSDVVVHFSSVNVAACTTSTRLLELRQLLWSRGRNLVLCHIIPATKSVFAITRLDEVFDFVKDRFAASAHFQITG